jgi:hypothetical protein
MEVGFWRALSIKYWSCLQYASSFVGTLKISIIELNLLLEFLVDFLTLEAFLSIRFFIVPAQSFAVSSSKLCCFPAYTFPSFNDFIFHSFFPHKMTNNLSHSIIIHELFSNDFFVCKLQSFPHSDFHINLCVYSKTVFAEHNKSTRENCENIHEAIKNMLLSSANMIGTVVPFIAGSVCSRLCDTISNSLWSVVLYRAAIDFMTRHR